MGVNRICFERFYSIKIFPKLISFILTRQGGPFGVHASSWCSHKNWIWWIRKLFSSIYACHSNISHKTPWISNPQTSIWEFRPLFCFLLLTSSFYNRCVSYAFNRSDRSDTFPTNFYYFKLFTVCYRFAIFHTISDCVFTISHNFTLFRQSLVLKNAPTEYI